MLRLSNVVFVGYLLVFWGVSLAHEGVAVDGVNYICETRCVVDTSTRPATVRDCCGGRTYQEIK
ncbi:hypothetical protein [Aliidiomarina taiwanensis]|nr:hypothetical protein [Aliidiomarina taiwanensis]